MLHVLRFVTRISFMSDMSTRVRFLADRVEFLVLAGVLIVSGCGGSTDTPEVLVQRGNLLRDEDRMEEAEEAYREAIKGFRGYLEDEPDSAYSWFQLGELYFQLDEREKALEAYQKAMEFSTEYQENSHAWYQIATLHERPEHAQEALEAYNMAIRINPEDAIAYNDRGWLYFDVFDNADLALNDFNEALRLDPDDVFPLANRAMVYASMGAFTESLNDWNRVLGMQPNLPANYFHRGNVRYELGDFAGAIEDFSQAVALDSAFGLAYLRRGVARRELGQTEAAEQDFQFARQVDPTLSPPEEFADPIVDLESIVVEHLSGLGYQDLRWQPNEALTLQGAREGEQVNVFVTSGNSSGTAQLTESEVAAIRDSTLPVDLVVVSPPESGVNPQVVMVVRNWSLSDAALRPIQYEIDLP